MSRVTDAPRQTATSGAPRTRHVCPFCGTLNESATDPCGKCTMMNTPQTRRVTRGRIGPWYVMQSRNPAAPGMKFDVLVAFIRKGQVTARSIVRGPTTHQFWRYAAHVKGLSREFGLCYACGIDVATESHLCPHCGKVQEPPTDVDALLETPTNSRARVAATKLNGAAANTETAQPVPEMVDAEVVPEPGNGQDLSDTMREATRVVIEPIVEVTPPLAEVEDEPDVLTADDLKRAKTNGRSPAPAHGTVDHGAADDATADAGHLNGRGVYHAGPVDRGSTALMSPADLEAAFHMKFTPVAEFHEVPPARRRFPWFAVALLLLVAGLVVAAREFPAERTMAVNWIVEHYGIARDWVMDKYAQYRGTAE